MFRQYLSQTNENAIVVKTKKFSDLNKALLSVPEAVAHIITVSVLGISKTFLFLRRGLVSCRPSFVVLGRWALQSFAVYGGICWVLTTSRWSWAIISFQSSFLSSEIKLQHIVFFKTRTNNKICKDACGVYYCSTGVLYAWAQYRSRSSRPHHGRWVVTGELKPVGGAHKDARAHSMRPLLYWYVLNGSSSSSSSSRTYAVRSRCTTPIGISRDRRQGRASPSLPRVHRRAGSGCGWMGGWVGLVVRELQHLRWESTQTAQLWTSPFGPGYRQWSVGLCGTTGCYA